MSLHWVLLLGTALIGFGLWLFWRSYVDLGKNWSVTLEVREGHNLTTGGVYAYTPPHVLVNFCRLSGSNTTVAKLAGWADRLSIFFDHVFSTYTTSRKHDETRVWREI